MFPPKFSLNILAFSPRICYRRDCNRKGSNMNIVINVDTPTFEQMKSTYQAPGTLPAGASFHAKLKGVTVTGYTKSHKVMFQGALANQEAARWQPNDAPAPSRSTPAPAGLPAGFATWSVLGSDEVGVGSYLGPLTTAAVFVAADQVASLTQLGVADSKKLTDPEIIRLAKQIMATCPVTYLNLMPAAYNARMKKYNQAQLKALCHNYVLAKTLERLATKPQAILIDQFVSERTYFNYLQGQPQIVSHHVYFQTKGEQAHVAVAAASIVARYQSLKAMDTLSEQAGITLPIGAGHAVDLIAAKLIRKGLDLNQFAKVHFANTQKARQLARQ